MCSGDSNRTQVDAQKFAQSGVESVYVRVFYPTRVPKKTKLAKAKWLSSELYGRALCEIVRIPHFIAKPLAAAAAKKSTPFYASTPLSDQQDSYPVVIFSHGLAGNRLIYSTLCSSLASHGMIVFAIEHRDQSGSLARGADGDWVPFHRIKRDDVDFCQNQVLFRAAEVQICLELIREMNIGTQYCFKKDPVVYDFVIA